MMIPTTPDNPTMTLVYILIIIIATSILTRAIAFLMNHMKRFSNNMTAIYLIRDIIKALEHCLD